MWLLDMDQKTYKLFTQKIPPKKKSRTRPLPKASGKYLEAFDRLKEILDRMEIKYEEYFLFKTPNPGGLIYPWLAAFLWLK